jgi:hypothetical protein
MNSAAICATDKLDKKTIPKLLEHEDLPDDCRQLLELRLDGAQAASKKVDTLLNRLNGDARVRGAFRHFGCETGRYSSEGAQIQNMKNPQTADIEAGSRPLARVTMHL